MAATNSGIRSVLPGRLPTNRSYSSLPAAEGHHHHPAAVADRGGGSALLTGPPAFVFDIDGVLIRGKAVLPEAMQAMAKVRSGGRRVSGSGVLWLFLASGRGAA